MYALQHPEKFYANTGGLISFLFTDAENLAYDPRPRRDTTGNLVVQTLPLLNNAQWQQASVLKYSLGYRERMRERDDGISFAQQLEGVIARYTPTISTILQQLLNRRFVLIAQDQNLYYRLIGSKEYPLRFSYDSDPGASPRDRNQVSFEFEGEQAHPAYFYTGDLLGQIATPTAPEVTARVTEDGIYIRILE